MGVLLREGIGSLTTVVVKRTYRDQWNLNLARVFCRDLDDGSFYIDNCIILGRLTQLLDLQRGTHERVIGDPFELAHRQKVPFTMPTTEITLAQLKASMRD